MGSRCRWRHQAKQGCPPPVGAMGGPPVGAMGGPEKLALKANPNLYEDQRNAMEREQAAAKETCLCHAEPQLDVS